MGRSGARRVTPSLQTPLLICFLAPFFGCPAKEGLVHGMVTAPVHHTQNGGECPRPTSDRSVNPSGPLHYVDPALDWGCGEQSRLNRYIRQYIRQLGRIECIQCSSVKEAECCFLVLCSIAQ